MSSRPSRGAARLAAILDALPDALLLVNCNGTVVNANSIALETFEAPGTALVGRGLLDLLPSFDSKRIPGSMRRRDEDTEGGRTKPTRMVARRTDGTELLVEVTSANLEDGRTPYESAFEAAYADHRNGYTGNELLMLVVRDLTGTLDTETELARQQRQTEMILRAAAEGVVGVDAEGKVVLVNPSAAQILGFRASELGGKELHPLIHHSRADGSALPWEETPLADTLKSGRKHRVRGQALWSKDGRAVPVDLTTAPVRDGDQLVGAVMTFTDRRAFDSLAARHTQLLAVLDQALRGPLEELKGELGTLASDPAGQLWPEANQILHHLAAGHARMTTLVDNVLSYQRLDSGKEKLNRTKVSLDGVVAAGVEGAIELIGPGRAQFAVHAPPIEATVDAERIAQALSHLIADVAGVDSTGRMPAGEAAVGGRSGPIPGDSTIVVAAAKRGDVVRIEVRGPFGGGDPVHEPIVRGIVRKHGGLMQTHEVPGGGPGAGGSAYVLELPVVADGTTVDGATGGADRADGPTGNETTVMPVPAAHARGTRGNAADTGDGADDGSGNGTGTGPGSGNGEQGPGGDGHEGGDEGRPGGDGGSGGSGGPGGSGGTGGGAGGPLGGGGAERGAVVPEQAHGAQPTGRRRARHSGAEQGAEHGTHPGTGPGAGVAHGAMDDGGTGTGGPGPGAAEGGRGAHPPHGDGAPGTQGGRPADGTGLPPGMTGAESVPPTGRRRGRQDATEGGGLPALPSGTSQPSGPGQQPGHGPVAGAQGGPAAGPQGPAATPSANGQAPVPAQASAPVPAQGSAPVPARPLPARPQIPGQASASGQVPAAGQTPVPGQTPAPGQPHVPGQAPAPGGPQGLGPVQPSGRRARRALAEAPERSAQGDRERASAAATSGAQQQAGARTAFALPPAAADRTPQSLPATADQVPAQAGPHEAAGPQEAAGTGRRRARRPVANGPEQARAGGQPEYALEAGVNSGAAHGEWDGEPTGRRRARRAAAEERAAAAMADSESSGTFVAGPEGLVAQHNEPAEATGTATGTAPGIAQGQTPAHAQAQAPEASAPQVPNTPQPPHAPHGPAATQDPRNPQAPGAPAPTGRRRGRPSPAEEAAGQAPVPPQGSPAAPHRQPLPPAAEDDAHAAGHSHGRAFSVRTLGQGVPFTQQIADQQRGQVPPGSTPPGGTPPGGTSAGSGRRRKLAAPPQEGAAAGSMPAEARPHPGAPQPQQQQPGPPAPHQAPAQPQSPPQPHLMDTGEGRAFAISAPDEGSEGPEPLDGPNGAIEVVDRQPMPMDDELPPEPLDNPRRLLVWPAPDVATQQALSDRGYRPVIVNSREEVDAQIAAYPAALFVDPLTGPITRTALQSLRQAAGAAEVPVLVTAGLGQATREAAYGADPAVLLKALAPRDSEVHPPRVLLIEENDAIAGALTASLERRGMQVARAGGDADAVTLATQMRPNLVVMDLMQVRRRRAGIVDWLRANGLLDHTPLVVYTSADMDPAQLPRLAAGETVLFLAERSTSAEVQARIVDLLAKIGTN
ncbi:PAS domain S-box-containing protein [Streptomyces sp. 2224.1]|uniref:PAS domain-containing protein n=1 Tax=Streptomyces sp. 2224.1 TaxID=1881020 RepID=UPI00089A66F2|nr:PAS domain-containing protein [Streptomyces sp. 2224.1]SEB92347.1 PAS domain S-box-containing protein [Streptomyces sp. 2224.1]